MFVSLIIVFREAIEAGFIVAIVLAATEGVAGRGRWIAGGVATGIAGTVWSPPSQPPCPMPSKVRARGSLRSRGCQRDGFNRTGRRKDR